MNKEKKQETVIARLIANTLTRKRPDNLTRIARDIRWLENDLDSLGAVSEIANISIEMLNRFLKVEKLCPKVQALVEAREIDSVETVNQMRKFDDKAQIAIAKEVITGQLSGKDIRVLAPLKNSLPHLTIDELISRVQKSRNIKVYVAYFRVPPGLKDANALKKRFEKIVGKTEIISLAVKDSIATLELTLLGQKKLRKAAKKCDLSLRKYVDIILLG
jgi:predicted HTH domain antitoxin